MEKITLAPATVLSPVPAVLVSCGDAEDNYNIIAVSWTGTLCSRPPMTYVSLRPATHSYHILEEKKEFVINLIPEDMLEVMDWCGRFSGRDVNKWQEKGLTPIKGETVKAPLIKECPVNIECKIVEIKVLGSHTMFMAEVTAVRADEAYVKEGRIDLSSFRTVANVGNGYMKVNDFQGRQGFSVK